MRLAAAKAFHEVECQQALTNSLHAGRRELPEFEVGQTVYFWRRAPGDKASKDSTSYWRGPAKVVLTSPPGAIWINFRRHIVKAAPEQLRHASEDEHQSLSSWMEGLSNLRHIMSEEPKAGYIDLTKEYKSEELDQDLEKDTPFEEDPIKKPRYKIEGKTPSKEVEARPEGDEWMWNEQKGILLRFHVNFRNQLFKPTDVEDCPVEYNKLHHTRRTIMYFEDGGNKEIVDDWRSENQIQDQQWKGRTEFYLDPTPLPWDIDQPKETSPTTDKSTEEEQKDPEQDVREENEQTINQRQVEDSQEERHEKKARREEDEEKTRGQVRRIEDEQDEDEEQGSNKRQRTDWMEIMFQALITEVRKQKGQNEIKLKDLLRAARENFLKAIKKEVDNNISTGAYEILSPQKNRKKFVELDTTSYSPDVFLCRRGLNQTKSKPSKMKNFFFEKMNMEDSRLRLDML